MKKRGWKIHAYIKEFEHAGTDKIWYESICGLVSAGTKTQSKDFRFVDCSKCLRKMEKMKEEKL